MKKNILILGLAILLGCNEKRSTESGEAPGGEQTTSTYKNPVLPGDFADPSVVRVGDDYYATATSSEWAPLYPILHSTDLVNWEIIAHVFPSDLPEWANTRFWAPEITYENGKFYVYYTAKKKDGPLCTGVASADQPEGPYTDHGPLICQEVGAIDGFAVRDENGVLHLVWKEDGNSRKQPTPIWAQEMNEERTALLGEKFELFRNDPDTWEGGLVEGVFIQRHGDYFYAFYSGDKCCGRQCTYGVGVARAKTLKGPWEKYAANPLMKQNETWKCAGHGSVVTDASGNDYYLYHAYAVDGFVYSGRQGLLDKITWGDDEWPHFDENAPSVTAEVAHEVAEPKSLEVTDDFVDPELKAFWQWPVGSRPEYLLDPGDGLFLMASPDKIGSTLAQRTLVADYTATVQIDRGATTAKRSGLSAIGDPNNAVGIAIEGDKIIVWESRPDGEKILSETAAPSGNMQFRIVVRQGNQMEFSWSPDGSQWNVMNAGSPVDSSFLPPWDRAVRIGLTVKGPENSGGGFSWFRMNPEKNSSNGNVVQ